jgi:hypothetical protein
MRRPAEYFSGGSPLHHFKANIHYRPSEVRSTERSNRLTLLHYSFLLPPRANVHNGICLALIFRIEAL